MVYITDDLVTKKADFEQAGIQLPQFDLDKMQGATLKAPQWAHLGGGNLYRCFHAQVAQDLLDQGEMTTGVVVFDTFGKALIENAYHDNQNRTLSVVMQADGGVDKTLIASTAESHYLNASHPSGVMRMQEVFESDSLQLVTVTITEKGYAVKDIEGNLSPDAQADIAAGPKFDALKTTMAQLAYLLLKRFEAGAAPLALVSTDNFSHNGLRFKNSVLAIVSGWAQGGLVPEGFEAYVQDDAQIAFPFSMIDRITPLPSQTIYEQLTAQGIEGMAFDGHPSFAPFVNTEATHYLVIEDAFPNGRPALDKGGVYLTDRDTVNKADLMKVCSCLNPLHTALAVTGCLLGYDRIYKEMQDSDLVALVERVGYQEGLKVVVDPKIIEPKQFIDEVVKQRLVNPNIPDQPQRIATDTSQKVGIRFGETIKAYQEDPALEVSDLKGIAFSIAAWLRYLLAVDDAGDSMDVSPDPLLSELQGYLSEVRVGHTQAAKEALVPILSNPLIFGSDLYAVGLAPQVEAYFVEMAQAPGKVRQVLHELAQA